VDTLLLTRSEAEALIKEFHNLERLAADRVYEFAYVATTNAIRGTVAGTALRPIALR
jgi:hypothetical protein